MGCSERAGKQSFFEKKDQKTFIPAHLWLPGQFWGRVIGKVFLGFVLFLIALPAGADTLAAQAARRFPQPVRVGDLLHRAVLKPVESQDVIGRVQHVVRQPGGGISVVISTGGLLGLGAHLVAVPVDAMVLVGQVMEVVGLTPAQLRALPPWRDGDGAEAPPDSVIKVGLAKPSH